jgi:hypothetical protein
MISACTHTHTSDDDYDDEQKSIRLRRRFSLPMFLCLDYDPASDISWAKNIFFTKAESRTTC